MAVILVAPVATINIHEYILHTVHNHQICPSLVVWKSLGVLLTKTCYCSRLHCMLKRSGGVGKERLMSFINFHQILSLQIVHLQTNSSHWIRYLPVTPYLFAISFSGIKKIQGKKSLCKSTVLTKVLFRKCIVALKSIGICPVPLQ